MFGAELSGEVGRVGKRNAAWKDDVVVPSNGLSAGAGTSRAVAGRGTTGGDETSRYFPSWQLVGQGQGEDDAFSAAEVNHRER